MVNGIPPIVSDRGGSPSVVSGTDYALPLAAVLIVNTASPVAP